ncbi:MAG: beta-lactamase family protein, partial [Myxococcales bacterium]|nr:beta-lactamase family protein [Myxococcales bacterium]
HRGRKVVDLWGGIADAEQQTPWQEDTLVPVFSVSKGIVATCVLHLSMNNGFDYDQPITEYWPEFDGPGKTELTARDIMNHRSGLVGISQDLTLDQLDEWTPARKALEEQSPFWTPGTQQGYHAVSYGLYVRELFERMAEERLGGYLAREISDPLGASVYLGLPDTETHRVARLYRPLTRQRLAAIPGILTGGSNEGRVARALLSKNSYTYRAFAHPAALGFKSGDNFNTTRVHQMELPWCNVVATARGLAKVYDQLAREGGDLIDSEVLAPVYQRQSWQEMDNVLRKPMGFSQGFVKEETRLFSPNVESFGHPGMGGALGWADPVARLSIGYVMNRMDGHVRSPRALALCHAAYSAL